MSDMWKVLERQAAVPVGKRIDLDRDFDPAASSGAGTKDESAEKLAEGISTLFELQDRFFADASRSLLIVLQATDAAGKDGTIKHVMSGLNPEGVDVHSFKGPTANELVHDYLWRHNRALPSLGKIAIFNRSHYENVLICRVHPNLVWPAPARSIAPADLWRQRYRQINDWERYLTENGTVIVKLFLNLSKDEQERRFLARIDDLQKNWKFSVDDIKERPYWNEYRQAFQEMINETDTEVAPWHVVPADHKWFSHLTTSAILVETLRKIDPQYPKVSAEQRAALLKVKDELIGNSGKPGQA
ncbi:MAG: polyphosphate kinase 2 family protein [Candidatus Nanopelagicales bacterium]|nr:polyphosphate kinase 2 family protein [Candidatus Nanopelagicales bacterium]